MAISGLQVINIGVENQSLNSDTLFVAFNKTKTNFATLFANASPYNTFIGNSGISVNGNSTTGTLDITNTGVLSISAGTGVAVNQSNGNVIISSTGGGGAGVTSVGVQVASTSRLTVTGSPIVSSGNITLDLATSGVTPGTYTYPTMTVDGFGRVTNISNGASVGTVTSVGITPGFGIQVTGSPITSSGNITILNTGVTRLTAGTGISLTSSNGNITVSTLAGAGTVTSVGVTSTSLNVTNSPVVAAGTINVELKDDISVIGNVSAANVQATGKLGYITGAGGTITQTVSRTTGVTIDKITGSITLFSAAGSTSYQTFVVTNNKVAASDLIVVNQRSGTDKYITQVTNVAAGSFSITFATTGGTTTEQPVFSFAVIKGVTA